MSKVFGAVLVNCLLESIKDIRDKMNNKISSYEQMGKPRSYYTPPEKYRAPDLDTIEKNSRDRISKEKRDFQTEKYGEEKD